MPAEMIKSVHVIERSCRREAVLEARLLAGAGDRLICLGAPPAGLRRDDVAASPPVTTVSRSTLKHRGRGLLESLRGEGIVCHCWSVAAAWDVIGVLPDRRPPMALRLAAGTSEDDTAHLIDLADAWQVALVFPSELATAGLEGTDVRGAVHVIGPPAALDAGRPGRAELRERLGIAPEQYAIAAPGEVRRGSGHRLAVWATAILAAAELPVRLILQHTGAAAWALAEFARDAGFAREVILADASIPEVLGAADAAAFLDPGALPALSAAMAMYAGVPIVAGDTPPAREWLAEGPRALLVPPDNARAVAAALMQLIEGPPLAAELAGAARSFAKERFDPAVVRRSWRRLHETLLTARDDDVGRAEAADPGR